ncbi:MAG: hypothetical protein RL693_131, partial [Verrucomicrobiota bacterium]
FEGRGRKILEQPHGARARLFEFGEDDGNAFYITENVDGETLRSYLASQSVLPVWLAMSLTVQVLEGMNTLLDVGCPLPDQPLEAIRVWQSGAQFIKAVVANFPMTEMSGQHAIKPKQAKILFVEESKKLEILFSESMQQTALGDEAQVESVRFLELLSAMLGVLNLEVKPSCKEIISSFESRMPLPIMGELASSLSPQPLLAALLKDSQTVARSLTQTVRIQSQKIDSINPYVMRGTLIKSAQQVAIEQVPPERMTGQHCHESLAQMLNLSKFGKFPNLLPVLFLTSNAGLECMGEPVVEGVALSEILEIRRALDPNEINVILKHLSTALGDLENAQQTTPRLRLEDIFLFTGPGIERAEADRLGKTNLVEWPNFSIVLRSHACLHAMSGRGTDPAALLPSIPLKSKDSEPLWHGGWLAALSGLLLGLSEGMTSCQRTGIPELDSIIAILEEEMKRARKGNPSPRALFLNRYSKQMEKHGPAEATGLEGWAELSGSNNASKRTADSGANVQSPMLAPDARMSAMEQPTIGFAEALIQRSVTDEPEFIGGLRPMRAAPQSLVHDDVESSWITVHEKRPFWWHIVWVLIGSLILGIGLAHLSGRAFWQKITPATAFEIGSLEVSPGRDIATMELPVSISKVSKSGATKLPVPPPLLQDVDLNGGVPMPASTSKSTMSGTTADGPKAATTTIPAVREASKLNDSAGAPVTAQLQALREGGGTLTPALRAETEKAAQAGNKEAMLALGNLFLRGGEGERDESSAFSWYDKASKAGAAAAALPLAECYLQGWGTKPDFTQAVNLLVQASQNGEARAKDLLAVCYARGLGVNKDDARAFNLFTEAYAAGIPSACGNLGAMYLRGQGTAPDAERAAKLFEEGAKKNHADSMLLYAQSLEYGTGTAANVEEAKRWYQKAAKMGNAEASSWCRKKSVAY